VQLNQLNKITSSFAITEIMPLLFVGHGSPMNAIEQNEFAKEWGQIGKTLPKPNAILCISAHWETNGTMITAMEKPPTIHDFGGFPQALFDVNYSAPGSPALAQQTKELITKTEVKFDNSWGLDHGCWSVVKNMYPNADIPVIEMSMDYTKPPQWHYQLAKELSSLRDKGVLILGSGNMVHNLRIMDWHSPDKGFDWAEEANSKLKKLILNNEHEQLMSYNSIGTEMKLAIPTPEHYMPLMYILGLKKENENVSFFNDKTMMGSISMTSVKIDKN
jgi:4,5-DOPA dioxygenase extradiol